MIVGVPGKGSFEMKEVRGGGGFWEMDEAAIISKSRVYCPRHNREQELNN